MKADGSDLTRLTRNSGLDGFPAWSPDGEQIAFLSDGTLYVMDADGDDLTRLTYTVAWDDLWTPPAWSPDGEQIAFVSERDGNYEIYVTDGGETARLTYNNAKDFSPAWSPDSKKIAFTSERDGNWDIYVLSEDEEDRIITTRLTRNSGVDIAPAWSPDGEQIAFVSDGTIYVTDGEEIARLTYTVAWDDLWTPPAWSPDSKKNRLHV